MSIRFALLGLLNDEPCGAGKLRQHFEDRTQGIWPMNIGQVYQTIQRLDRDGLIEKVGTDNSTNRPADIYATTDAGRAALEQWWNEPTLRPRNDRDDLVIKIAVAAVVRGVDNRALIQGQREATMRELRDITLSKASTPPARTAQRLLLERRIFDLEAEARWLDHIETLAEPEGPRS
ncbi:PadR family transcriptional regulator [Corynebacterium sp. P7202]|uniref:PadR family transcriptional regulator n=1 Tax=Corynebacterium pygosceleis TaxID=2800406 RepID=A0A9Q4GJQ0_9CORY|nr:PadR family transcriptional regulator [Corynebacterium pygosceleis]MCK7637293.1 PadR family transcriptional regulator [Corynebacterium pygosceleis]MCX7468379.1 PadR family transcriptional regulator [Corynebacterium pygosceleis]